MPVLAMQRDKISKGGKTLFSLENHPVGEKMGHGHRSDVPAKTPLGHISSAFLPPKPVGLPVPDCLPYSS